MYKGKKVSIILPAYNEEACIETVIKDFNSVKEVDEIVVVDNNSTDKTAKIARKTRIAKIVTEIKQGYGHAIAKGLASATGDILITCDADMTYKAKDLKKLLKEQENFDFVWATRMNTKYLIPGANMRLMRRIANVFLSKVIQFRFSPRTSLTDIGATFRLLNKAPYKVISNQFTVGGGSFQPELTILALKNGFSIKEVPVYYGPRVGESKISGSLVGGLKTAKKMVNVIFKYIFASV